MKRLLNLVNDWSFTVDDFGHRHRFPRWAQRYLCDWLEWTVRERS